jgi:preprotein translocase subunit SecG
VPLEFLPFDNNLSAFPTMGALFVIILSLLAIFLILLILVQRGRGGGLAGALGGMGGSSAFGAKAGDVFTRITIITASIWIAISLIAVFWAKDRGDALSAFGRNTTSSAPSDSLPGRPVGQPAAPQNTTGLDGQSQTQAEAPAAAAGPAENAEATPATPPATDGATAPANNGGAAPANNQ